MAITKASASAWTDHMLQTLKEYYPHEGYKGVRDRLNGKKSKSAIIAKAHRLGLASEAPREGHGMVGTRTYRAWYSAKQRVLNEGNEYHYLYRGKGMAKEWVDSFDSFLRDMGPAPTDKHQIDRIDPDKGYEPSNCRWVTPQQNAANSKKENATGYKGVTLLPSGKYRATIRPSGNRINLGVFECPIKAALEYDRAAVMHFGEYAMTNARMGRFQG